MQYNSVFINISHIKTFLRLHAVLAAASTVMLAVVLAVMLAVALAAMLAVVLAVA